MIRDDSDKIAGLYNIGSTIGKGHFAVVKEAKHVFTEEKVAIKIIDKTKLDVQAKEHLFSEVMCMKLVQHPNIVRLYEVIDTVNKLYLVLELGDGGDLYDYIMKFDNGLSEVDARKYFRQIIHAISYCHNLHVCHRDLKPENVVFFEKLGLVKLTDFGFSNKFTPGETLKTSCGSLAYSAPEILLGDDYDAPKVDIWSLGVLLFMLVCGRLPFQEANDSETLSRIMDCKYEFPPNLSASCRSLICKMLVREPTNRANLDDILKDKWLEIGARENHELETVCLPLISQHCLSVEDHLEILNKMSEGGISTVDEIQNGLDRNEYSYISATYYLLAERKLKRRYIEEYLKLRFKEEIEDCEDDVLHEVNESTVETTSNQEACEERFRRFSMILEDEEDEEEVEELEAVYSLASVKEELEIHESKGPFPSRSCSRISNVGSNNNNMNELESGKQDSDHSYSNFRLQFTNRNRCKSAIYNKIVQPYYSRSLSSIPNYNLVPSKSNKQFQSNSTSVIPRFSRRTSSVVSPNESSFDDNFSYSSKHRTSLPAQSLLTSHSNKRRSFPALLHMYDNFPHSHSISDVSFNRISIGNKYTLPTSAQLKINSTSNSSIASENIRVYPNNRRLRLKSTGSRPNSLGATNNPIPLEELQFLIASATKNHIEERNKTSSVTNSPTVANITLHRDICAPIHEEDELIRSRSYIDKDTSSFNSSPPPLVIPPAIRAPQMKLSFRSASVDNRVKSDSADVTPSKWANFMTASTSTSKPTNQQTNPIHTSPLQQNSYRLQAKSLSSSSQHLTQSNFSLSSLASSLRDSRVMMNVIRGAFELQTNRSSLQNPIASTNHQTIFNKNQNNLTNMMNNSKVFANRYSQYNNVNPVYCRSEVNSANASGRESQNCELFTTSLTSLPEVTLLGRGGGGSVRSRNKSQTVSVTSGGGGGGILTGTSKMMNLIRQHTAKSFWCQSPTSQAQSDLMENSSIADESSNTQIIEENNISCQTPKNTNSTNNPTSENMKKNSSSLINNDNCDGSSVTRKKSRFPFSCCRTS